MIDYSLLLATILVLLVLFGLIMEVWRPWADHKGGKLLRLGLLALSLFALYRFALPPAQPLPPQTLVVLGAGAQLPAQLQGDEIAVALPEWQGKANGSVVARVPDLATALRSNPAAVRLRLLGEGLGARDWQAAERLPVDFEAPPAVTGIVSMTLPEALTQGQRWRLRGVVAGHAGAIVELRDPYDQQVSSAVIAADGGFAVVASTPVPGSFLYQLVLLDAQDEVVERVSVPLQVRRPHSPRLLLRSKTPNPEVKFLRRWAADAGLRLNSRIELRPLLSMGLGESGLDAENLAQTDLLIIDDRSWSELGSGEREVVVAAVEAGLGLLLRLTDEPDSALTGALASLGFSVEERAEMARIARLPANPSTTTDGASAATGPLLQRRLVSVVAARSHPLLVDDSGEALGRWRAHGDGRIGLLWVSDTHRLRLAGERALYGSLWSDLSATLARPLAEASGAHSNVPHYWVNQRIQWCALTASASVASPAGKTTELAVNDAGCAAFWPDQSGWHHLRSADSVATFYVRESSDGRALAEQLRRQRNLLLSSAPVEGQRSAEPSAPGPRLPWWLLWLFSSAALWWLERRATTIA